MAEGYRRKILAGVVITVMIAATAIVAAGIGVQTGAVTEGDPSVPQVKEYFVRLLGTRPGWPSDMTADEQRIISEHFEYLKDLVEQKKVLMAGPCFDPVFGLIILRVDSREEAVAIMNNEPSVKQGVHTYDLNEMKVSLMAGQK